MTLTDPNRWGLLGKGSVLMVTSYANRTAPVLRGAWILENIMGTPPAAPPPDVEGFKENKEGEKARTVREIMEQHRAKPSCNACHGVMDPLGLRARELRRDRRVAGEGSVGRHVDRCVRQARGRNAGERARRPAQGADEAARSVRADADREADDLRARAAASSTTTCRRFAQIVRDAARENYRFSSIVMGIVKSAPFQMRKASDDVNSGRGVAEDTSENLQSRLS